MPPRATRAVSPAVSENEVDILGSLFTDDSAIPNGKTTKDFARDGFGFDANELLDAPDDEGDDGFINDEVRSNSGLVHTRQGVAHGH